jgi:hypothetical protein
LSKGITAHFYVGNMLVFSLQASTLYFKNCPNFSNVFRQPFSGARTDQLSSRILQNEEIFHIGITCALKMREGFYTRAG